MKFMGIEAAMHVRGFGSANEARDWVMMARRRRVKITKIRLHPATVNQLLYNNGRWPHLMGLLSHVITRRPYEATP